MGRQTNKKKISTSNFRLFITRMDLIGLRCLYTLSLIKLITRNPPLTIVSPHSFSHSLSCSLVRTCPLLPFTFNQKDDKRNGPFIRPFTHMCAYEDGRGRGSGCVGCWVLRTIQHMNVMQRFCTLARSNRIKFIFRCLRMVAYVCWFIYLYNECVCGCCRCMACVANSIILYISRVFFLFLCVCT